VVPKPNGADKLLSVIDEEPRGRSELLELCGVSGDEWRPVIQYLLDMGHVRQLGTRRGARYVLTSSRYLEPERECEPEPKWNPGEWPEGQLKPKGAEELLAVIRDEPQGRSHLLHLADMSLEDWRPAIRYLLDMGHVRQLGTRRGARYVLASSPYFESEGDSVREAPASYDGRQEGGPKGAYHDLIGEVLQELEQRVSGPMLVDPRGAEDVCDSIETPGTTTDIAHLESRWSTDEVRMALVSFRENTLEPDLKPEGRSIGLLRKAMIEALLRERPRNRREFMLRMPDRLLQSTDQSEIEEHLAAVLEILQRLDPEA
jgi:hypothetical protein